MDLEFCPLVNMCSKLLLAKNVNVGFAFLVSLLVRAPPDNSRCTKSLYLKHWWTFLS